MSTLEQYFNSRVSEFLSRTGMGATTLGLKAVGDPNLLREIAEGRSPSLRIADRVLAFIDNYDADSGGARAPSPRRSRPRPSAGAARTRRTRGKTERPMERKTNRPARILRSPEVEALTGLSRSTIYRWRVAGRFPPAVVMGGRTLGWFESVIEEWLHEQTEERGGGRADAPSTPRRGEAE